MIDETDLETCRELWMKDVDRHAVERSSLEARIAELERELDEVKGAFLRDDTARSYAAAIRHAREERDDLASQLAVAVEALDYAIRGFDALADEIEAHRPGWMPDKDISLLVREHASIKSIADCRQALASLPESAKKYRDVVEAAKHVYERAGQGDDYVALQALGKALAALERERDENEKLAIAAGEDVERMREKRDGLAAQLAVAVGALTTIKQVYEARSELFTDDAALAENLAARANKALAALDVEGK